MCCHGHSLHLLLILLLSKFDLGKVSHAPTVRHILLRLKIILVRVARSHNFAVWHAILLLSTMANARVKHELG